jgi:hypothetical protein
MSEPKLENVSGLIISSEELTRIREACQRRRAELEAAGALPPLGIAPGSPQGASSSTKASPPIPEAERFAAAVPDMPANVRRFFQHEEPAAFHQPESVENNAERRLRESFGGWCG